MKDRGRGLSRREALAWVIAPLGACARAEERLKFPDGAAFLGGPCATAAPHAQIAAENEPGRRLVVRGQVFRPDGRTPAAGVILYAYHTDAAGLYNPRGVPGARLHAWVRTDVEGRYEYRSIRPGAYPGRTVAAHIHLQLWGKGVPPQYNYDVLFEDDPLVSAEDRRLSSGLGSFAFVHAPREEKGVLHLTHDIRLKPDGDFFEENIMHGLRPCAK
jgi:protocatechuate 3,4-dioxygenase beta subunit